MTGPVHFDVDAMRAAYNVTNAQALASARAKAGTEQALLGIDLQERFLAVMVEASIIQAQARNDGFDERSIAKAFGHMLGNSFGNYLSNMSRRHRLDCLLIASDAFQSMMDACADGKPPEGMVSSAITVSGTRGGHA